MQKTELRKWLLLIAVVIAVVASATQTCSQPVAEQPNLSVPAIIDCGKSYSNILRALRDNWESPITYLKKRGYLPKGSELLFANNGAGDEQLIQVEGGDSPAELQGGCDTNKNVQARDEGGVDDVPDEYSSKQMRDHDHDPFSYIAEPKKGFLGSMKDKLLGLFGNGKKHCATSTTDSTANGAQKLNEHKPATKMPTPTSTCANTKAAQPITVPYSKDWKAIKPKYGYVVTNSNSNAQSVRKFNQV